jgi:hypothetical protein
MAIIPADERVFMVGTSTNTTYGGSAALKAMQQWYTMQDVADSVQPYKVFTALVKQEGDDGPYNIGAESPVTLGITYYISDNSNDVDLTVFGAPNSNIGTWFICTTAGALPNDPGVLLTYNTGTPVVTVLENTIGNIWFQYIDEGRYGIYSVDLFDNLKTFINGARLSNDGYATFNQFIESGSGEPTNRGYFFILEQGNETFIGLNTIKNPGDFQNDIIPYPICIEIKVYN